MREKYYPDQALRLSGRAGGPVPGGVGRSGRPETSLPGRGETDSDKGDYVYFSPADS